MKLKHDEAQSRNKTYFKHETSLGFLHSFIKYSKNITIKLLL